MADTCEKRRLRRASVAGRLGGDICPIIAGAILELSLGGACIEHWGVLRPGWLCDATLRERGGARLSVRVGVVWALVDRVEKEGRGRVLI